MLRLFLIFGLIGFATSPVRAAVEDDAGPTPSITQLIGELGDKDYAVRRRAEERLLRMGPEAFDELSTAADSNDLEIAERVQYIIQRLQMRWVHPGDAPEVRRILTRFGELSEEARLDCVEQLAKVAEHAGLAALCRIARFDGSALVARHAATAVLKTKLTAEERQAVAPAWRVELGKSDRPPVHWIELYLTELDDPQRSLAAWANENAAELALYKKGGGLTDFITVYDLLDRQLTRSHDLDASAEVTAALLAVIDLTYDANEPNQLDAGLAWAVRWIITNRQWDSLAPIEEKFELQIKKSRKLLYYLAAASGHAGREQRAAELAERAFNLSAEDNEERITIATSVAEFGYIDWAEREYRRIIEKLPTIDPISMAARTDLAMWMHDREDYQGAADILGEFCDAIDADSAGRRRLITEIDSDTGAGRAAVRGVQARRLFYLACVDQQRQDYDAQRQRLTEAAAKFDQDPDILIALYRLPTGTDDQRQAVQANIRKIASATEAIIKSNPNGPGAYNQWAWLIANTEGDKQKAVEFSLKSLELAPNEPSYLDTLGRCYYAVGDLENAVKSQRKAVELAPHYRVMQRQLALFEEALAKQLSP